MIGCFARIKHLPWVRFGQAEAKTERMYTSVRLGASVMLLTPLLRGPVKTVARAALVLAMKTSIWPVGLEANAA